MRPGGDRRDDGALVYKFYGDVVNPWDASRWPGGSSSGTGAAVAAGLCLGGLGTDTGVSVRGPASWLGLVGVRPSYGRVSVRGTFPRAYSFDTVGPLAHTVEDAAILLTAIAGYDPSDRYARPSATEDFTTGLNAGIQGLRVGVVEDFTFRNVDLEVGRAVQAAVDQLAKLGASVKTVKIPLFSGKIDFRYPLTILLYEFNQIFGDTFRATANKQVFGPVVHANIAQGEKIRPPNFTGADRRSTRRRHRDPRGPRTPRGARGPRGLSRLGQGRFAQMATTKIVSPTSIV